MKKKVSPELILNGDLVQVYYIFKTDPLCGGVFHYYVLLYMVGNNPLLIVFN